MQDKTNICGDRLDYEVPTELDESQTELYQSAAKNAEDALAIIEEIQQNRTNESGDVCKPISQTSINTVTEVTNEYLQPALSILAALEEDQQ